ncbi:MAG: BNR-4 repeat-containing protein [Planctomycetota bacterium]
MKPHADTGANDGPTVEVNATADGYRGIWYAVQPSGDEYVYKYSGGMGTYCAKHQPFAVHCPEVGKTFFCYGGAPADDPRRLLHMVGFYDHATGTVPRPTIVMDKATPDAHDNPVIAVDDAGCIWVFSTAHGRDRPSFIHRSAAPYDISRFQRVQAFRRVDGEELPLDNFSYFQAWHDSAGGFICPLTWYAWPAERTACMLTSRDGVRWSSGQRLAAIEKGHYQISAVRDGTVACAMNYHPAPHGLNWRTNLYYITSDDLGRTWRTADGRVAELPLTEPDNPALVHDWRAEKRNVYLKDITFDVDGRPVVLVVTSRGYASGPDNDPRTWTTVRWTGRNWDIRPVTTSDNNYDTGSLYVEPDGTWRIIAPTLAGPQPYNPGGEIAMWVSPDRGRTWEMTRRMTGRSERNHNYVRRPVNAHPDFYGFWADGHARRVSGSVLYFCNKVGDVFALPAKMEADQARPVAIACD